MKHTNNTKANFPPLSPEKCCTEFKENIFFMPKSPLSYKTM